MVRALPNHPFWNSDFLERIRPGFAVSAALHVGLFMALAYFLAFQPAASPPQDTAEDPIVMRTFPPPKPLPIRQEKTPIFNPHEAPAIEDVHTTVRTLVIPPHENFDRTPPTTVTSTEPTAPAVIKDPQPLYRGGLVYPERAADAGVGGYVEFAFIIEPDGSVGDPQVIAEVPDGYGFAVAAKKAFPKWRFEPKLVDGKPVAAPATIRVTFKLQ
jgi:TonB family protein